MTKCDRCGREVGALYCGKCRAEIEKIEPTLSFKRMIPLLFYDKVNKCYRFGCTVEQCPCNRGGVCVTAHLTIDSVKAIMHEFDGDNIAQQHCG